MPEFRNGASVHSLFLRIAGRDGAYVDEYRDGFYNGTSIPVNISLLTVFMAAGYAEQSGHDIPTIIEKYGRDVFSLDDGMGKS